MRNRSKISSSYIRGIPTIVTNVVLSIPAGESGSKFNLDPTTGALSCANLDRETVSKYVLTISAKDKGRPSLEARCNVTVYVIDLNDNAPTFVHNQYADNRPRPNPQNNEYVNYGIPTSGQHGQNYQPSHVPTRYAATISEDAAPESSVMSVKATDPDQANNGKITYTMADESTWLFRVDNLTGVITTAG